MTSTLDAQPVRIDTNVAVRMRDGVVLRADIWRPASGGRFPTLVYRTPYGKHQSTAAFATARKAVARGYAVVMQDVRGRYASDGEFLPYQQEGKDGYDTIEWAAQQSWSNGAVGTYGLSYPGAVQWLAAIENPPSLKAMVPAMTFARPMQFWYSSGVWDNSWLDWIRANIVADRSKRLGGDTTLARIAPWLFDWQKHPPFDPWWSWADLTDKYARTNAAVLSISGWHDDAYGPDGATRNFAGLVAARRGVPARAALLMGPWTHGVPRRTVTSAGVRSYGPEGTIDYDEIVLGWMDHYMRHIDNAVGREAPIRMFVMGSNRWIRSDAWPIPGTQQDTMRLVRAGSATTINYDPTNPVRDEYAGRAGAHDYRRLSDRSDVVIFESEPLQHDKTVVGAMRAELFISADAPDADVWVKVLDVAPDGTAFNLMSPGLDVQRASYRSATHVAEPLERGRIYLIRLDDLLTANTFKTGHRIRVVVTPSWTPGFAALTHPVRITVHHSARYPSRLILPTLSGK
jgi:putative CocE/NonD family hydrolase